MGLDWNLLDGKRFEKKIAKSDVHYGYQAYFSTYNRISIYLKVLTSVFLHFFLGTKHSMSRGLSENWKILWTRPSLSERACISALDKNTFCLKSSIEGL